MEGDGCAEERRGRAERTVEKREEGVRRHEEGGREARRRGQGRIMGGEVGGRDGRSREDGVMGERSRMEGDGSLLAIWRGGRST